MLRLSMFFLSRRPFHVNVVGGFVGVDGLTRVGLESFSRLPCRLQNFIKASPMHEEPHFAADDIVVKNLFNFVFPSRVFELFAQLDRFLFELGHARIGVQLQTVHVEYVMDVAIVRQVKSKTEW